VQFIHKSVNEFLLRNQRLQRLDAALESNPASASHNRLKACCMSYVMMGVPPLPKDSPESNSFGSAHPFLEYASTYAFDRAEAAEAGHVGQAKFLQRLREVNDVFERVRLFHNSSEQNPGSRCVGGVSLLTHNSCSWVRWPCDASAQGRRRRQHARRTLRNGAAGGRQQR
jgi:hypothetical protein